MKWSVGLLLLANVALYLWLDERNEDHEQVPLAQPEVNREGMLLLHELGGANSSPAAQATADFTAPATTAKGNSSCYRIGPFKEATAWQAANQWMKSRQFAHQAVRSASRELRAIRVYLGPFESHAEAQPIMDWLDERSIEHFIKPGKLEQVRISLGYFIQEALAVKFIAYLLSQDIVANSQPEYRTIGPFDWLEASIAPTRRNALLSHDWREKGVATLEITCNEISPSGKAGV